MDLLQSIEGIFIQRNSRAYLDTTKSYIKVQRTKAGILEEPVGRFVRSYCMGSGDGMTLHWEFIKDDKTIVIDDQRWGPIDGSTMVEFKEDPSANDPSTQAKGSQ
jgi:hypothetical protein